MCIIHLLILQLMYNNYNCELLICMNTCKKYQHKSIIYTFLNLKYFKTLQVFAIAMNTINKI